MSKTKVLKQKQEISETIEEPEEILPPAPKVKKQLTQEQLDNLAKAREKARERKIELGQISAKAKGLKEEKLRKDAEEYDKLISQKTKPEPPQKEEIIELAPIRHPAILALGLQLGDTGRSGSCPGDSNPTRSPGGGQRGVTSAARLQPGPATRGSPWPLPRGARPGSCRTPPSRGSDGGGAVEPRHPVYLPAE